jgi:hypothetical protein
VAEHQRQGGVFQLAVQHMQIGAADAAGADLEQQLPRSQGRRGELAALERLAAVLHDHREHTDFTYS